MVLTPEEELLIKQIRALGPGEVERMRAWASQLAEITQGRPVEYADSWSDEDLADVTAASLQRFDQREQEGV